MYVAIYIASYIAYIHYVATCVSYVISFSLSSLAAKSFDKHKIYVTIASNWLL